MAVPALPRYLLFRGGEYPSIGIRVGKQGRRRGFFHKRALLSLSDKSRLSSPTHNLASLTVDVLLLTTCMDDSTISIRDAASLALFFPLL
jgi:hypothetical protein